MLSRISIRNHQKEEISELDDVFLKAIINRKPQMSHSFLKSDDQPDGLGVSRNTEPHNGKSI
jgi:ribosome biogenesis protein Nip4